MGAPGTRCCNTHRRYFEQAQDVRVFADRDGHRIVIEQLAGDMRTGLSRGENVARTVETYSFGNLFVVYEINRYVCAYRRTQRFETGELAQRAAWWGTHLADRTISYNDTLDRLYGSPGGLSGSAVDVSILEGSRVLTFS